MDMILYVNKNTLWWHGASRGVLDVLGPLTYMVRELPHVLRVSKPRSHMVFWT